jgi:hypothetical protein
LIFCSATDAGVRTGASVFRGPREVRLIGLMVGDLRCGLLEAIRDLS